MRIWHRAERPSWDCVICHLPWPCSQAKVELAEEFLTDPVSGTIYLAMSMHDAINDSFYRTGPEPAELWNRFLGWYVALRVKPKGDPPPDRCVRWPDETVCNQFSGASRSAEERKPVGG